VEPSTRTLGVELPSISQAVSLEIKNDEEGLLDKSIVNVDLVEASSKRVKI